MNNNTTAVEREKAGTVFELNAQYENCKTEKHEYQVGKEKCVIVRHYCGDKDLNEVLYRNAFERAFSEVMNKHERPQSI